MGGGLPGNSGCRRLLLFSQLCWLQWYFCWLLQTGYSYSLPVLTPLLKWVPTFPAFVMDPVLNAYKAANYVFPLNEAIAGMFVMGLIIGAHRLVRWVKQWAPTLSN